MSATPRQLLMPKLGLTMTEGMVSKWQIAEGQRFAAGDVVVVVESEKTAIEVDAPAAGVLDRILVGESETVPVGTELAHWRLDGEDAAVPAAAVARAGRPDAIVAHGPTAPAAAVAAMPAAGGRRLATPLARRIAVEAGVDLAAITGTGPRGRIHAADVKVALEAKSSHQAPPSYSSASAPAPARASGNVRVPTGIERTMASRVTAAKRDIPHFYLALDVDVASLLALRRSLNDLSGGRRVSVTHLLIAAVVYGLRAVPRMNTVWTEEGYLSYDRIDVGIAVDTDRGLLSPVVHDLGDAGFYAMAAKIDEVIARARQGALLPDDQGGGAITVSNAGMHHMRYMTSIIVPGQSAILGVGAVQECFRPDRTGAPVLKRELGVVLSADHRVHTGVGCLEFLKAFEQAVTEPLRLLT